MASTTAQSNGSWPVAIGIALDTDTAGMMFRFVDIRHKLEGTIISALGGVGAALGAQGFRGWPQLLSWGMFAGALSYLSQPRATGPLDQRIRVFHCRARRIGWLLAGAAIALWLGYGRACYVPWVVRVCGLLGVLLGLIPC